MNKPFELGELVVRTDRRDGRLYEVTKAQYRIGYEVDMDDPTKKPEPVYGVGVTPIGIDAGFCSLIKEFRRISTLELLAEAAE